ncbi:telomerase reverse transcriptase [Trypanosoma equiperdum]|uniref:Telomerase reverse transcriptase n=3 Tax=Trypanozoon TaxID=39700 RepID=Q383R0_TRYB2|nr:telomerase reverse transcriptase, putative [Trypanosoma brucei brucei TREU927]AAX07161.1 telomerase reverse transcriptase [Trypanosoma brucei]EAN79971.1 telomerase reverse transcriptase, putative [Trypanosoma brucei brucei TREU927]SCU72766.1 telomerase reverse transcriptase [Trypanosoma equiperdum]
MAQMFPSVPGYDGPFSLKDFLHNYIGLQLRWSTPQENSTTLPPSNSNVVVVPPTGNFHVVVYVSRSAPPPQRSVRSVAVLSSCSNKMDGDHPQPSVPTHFHGRPLTSSVLKHPFWDALFSQIGPTAVSFIVLWAPIVVQFEASGGGLQVLGPPLKRSASCAVKRQPGAGWWEGKLKVSRTETLTQNDPHCFCIEGTSSPVALYRLNVPRLHLVEQSPLRSTADARHAVTLILEQLWIEHHKSSCSPSSDRDISQRLCGVATGSATNCCGDSCVVLAQARNQVNAVFPYTLLPVHDDAVSGNGTVKEYLIHVLHCALGSVCRMNIRGAAIKHTEFLEKRGKSVTSISQKAQTAGQENKMRAIPVGELTVPEPVVASYLETLFNMMWWRVPPRFVGGAVTADRVKFWGEEGTVLTRLREVTVDWLCCGRHEVFLLSHFLDGVPVSRIPWLRGFYTKEPARKRRSMIQQRVFLQLVLFLYQCVVPFLIRRSFHVACTSKSPYIFFFIPRAVWVRLTRREMRRVCIRRVKRMRSDTLSDPQMRGHAGLPPMALERVTSEGLMQLIGPSSQPVGDDSGGVSDVCKLRDSSSPLLYSDVRFLVDGSKLRPIARPRFGWQRSLLKAADGVGSSTLASALAKAGKYLATDGKAMWPSPNSAVLRDALRCLDAGVEERRITTGARQRAIGSHNDEYIEVRSFIQCARQFCTIPTLVQGETSAALLADATAVTMVRGDAARCYDHLPQEAVVNIMRGLVTHETYYSLKLTVVTLTTVKNVSKKTRSSHAESQLSSMKETNGSTVKHRKLQLSKRVKLVPGRYVQEGVLYGIARGCIAYEEQSVGSDSLVSGEEIRSVLQKHLQSHLVMLNGKMYIQRMGINQGSAVAMLLCDQLLERVDAALSSILSEHEEPALLLRRVDDVLVVTLSRAAASRCEDALRSGWSEIGFFCQEEKLRRVTCGQPVRWCGLLWDPVTLEFAVDWARLAKMMPYLAVRPRTGCEPLLSSLRFIRILRLRTPMTALCRQINSKSRVVQTLYEIGLLWSRFFLDKLKANAAFFRPHVRTILQPLALATATLRRLVRKHSFDLQRLGSFCDVTDVEVRLCISAALYHTLHQRLAFMIGRMSSVGKKKFLILMTAVLKRKMGELGSRINRNNQMESSLPSAADLLLVEGGDGVVSRGLAAVRFRPVETVRFQGCATRSA